MYSCGELFMRSREGYFGVYFPSCAATKKINTTITLEWAHKQIVMRVFYFLYDNGAINDDKNNGLHTTTPRLTRSVYIQLMTSQSIADSVTMTRIR